MIRVGVLSAVLALLAGCGSVTSVQGWAGGRVMAGVEEGQAVVVYDATGADWTLTVDRGTVDGSTAVLWLTATAPDGAGGVITPIRGTWTPPGSGASAIQCTQANIRIRRGSAAPGAYLPAGVGCGPLPD